MSALGRSSDDTLAIQAVVVKYGFLIDDRDWDAFDQVFTEDATVDFGSAGSGPMLGRANIVAQFRELAHPYQHMLVAHQIDDVSEDEVIVRSKALLPLQGGSIADILYRDVVVRTPEGWRIKDKSIKSYHQD